MATHILIGVWAAALAFMILVLIQFLLERAGKRTGAAGDPDGSSGGRGEPGLLKLNA